MARSNVISTEFHCSVQKNIKLDFAVTKNVGIWCAASFVFSKHIIDNTLFVFAAEIDCLKGNAKMLCHNHRIVAVVKPRTRC